MSNHTPGPWLIDGRVIRSKFGGQICMFSTWISQTANETDGNARLIAAAPELLEALQQYGIDFTNEEAARAEFGDRQVDRELMRRAAIAKATGGE